MNEKPEPVGIITINQQDFLVAVRDDSEYGFIYEFFGERAWGDFIVLFKIPLQDVKENIYKSLKESLGDRLGDYLPQS